MLCKIDRPNQTCARRLVNSPYPHGVASEHSERAPNLSGERSDPRNCQSSVHLFSHSAHCGRHSERSEQRAQRASDAAQQGTCRPQGAAPPFHPIGFITVVFKTYILSFAISSSSHCAACSSYQCCKLALAAISAAICIVNVGSVANSPIVFLLLD